ncbi:hypothetical protein BHM03_00059740 [Ensete ventricosum]|nr:hypothetical protein BHM03_00059740 [Ensete ventricosum]
MFDLLHPFYSDMKEYGSTISLGMITCSATHVGMAACSATLTHSDGRLRTKLPHEAVPPAAGAVALG